MLSEQGGSGETETSPGGGAQRRAIRVLFGTKVEEIHPVGFGGCESPCGPRSGVRLGAGWLGAGHSGFSYLLEGGGGIQVWRRTS